ncbi:D-alanyl-D-alanine carboxypeptidase/D-alanyl-D-alanine endopeptidase [Carboxylicivirga linearis]|uniref:D-alanyl-D-alanine carboxypeptidase/D-alanyl-D-alanine-endopeptidase n=1 Tax=Carboxylicivirga linearis TaxID=1628157 RepID=A0ABS5K0A7_9BACT|nr:D-alanyl-D-alanine carboxypeptidase/D-alanyl-D-alanine-endopeptidase [Carboxylicivirga linearis]MBS2100540.1 D-alanyl-D-alanine carboxypeptidase/D-alanyl-D-alanine-endopeptidase [Carboxylicivirga linearis]
MNKLVVGSRCKVWLSIMLVALIACSNSEKREDYTNQLSNISVNGFISASVIDLKTNQSLIAFNEQKRLISASLTKIFTTGAAYDLLGGNYRFFTNFYLSNSKKPSLIVKGGGDPTLGSDRWETTSEDFLFKHILNALRKNKVFEIHDVVIDDNLFLGVSYPSKRNWEDMANYYGATPHALTYKENTFRLTLSSPKQVGKICRVVKSDPEIDKQFNCLVKSSSVNKDSAYIYGHPDMDQWYVSGSIPAGRTSFVIKGALPDPSNTFATRLRLYLSANGIMVRGGVVKGKVEQYSNKKELLIHQSPALNQIIKVINKKSFNLFADHVFFQMALEQDKQANWDNSSFLLQNYWKERIDKFSGVFYDGSGLSPFNRFSSDDMVKALSYIYDQDYSDEFMSSLSVAGEDGTLKSLFKEDKVLGSFIGKSGSMNNVLGYCGYLTTQSGNEYAVCIMVNGFSEPFSEVRHRISLLLKDMMQNQ